MLTCQKAIFKLRVYVAAMIKSRDAGWKMIAQRFSAG